MKTFSIFLIVAFFTSTTVWYSDFEKAKQLAQHENHFILLNFSGSDWCGACIKMDKDIFSSEVFNQYASQHLVLVRSDFPRAKKNQLDEEQIRRNELLAEKYNPQGHFPFTLLLDEDGNVITKWEGYHESMTPNKFINELQKYIAK